MLNLLNYICSVKGEHYQAGFFLPFTLNKVYIALTLYLTSIKQHSNLLWLIFIFKLLTGVNQQLLFPKTISEPGNKINKLHTNCSLNHFYFFKQAHTTLKKKMEKKRKQRLTAIIMTPNIAIWHN